MMKNKHSVLLFTTLLLLASVSLNSQVKKALSIEDIMKFKSITNSSISEDGEWVLCNVSPDRGDPEVQVLSSNGKKKHIIPLAEGAVFSDDGKWVAMRTVNPIEEELKKKDNKSKYVPGMILMETNTGELTPLDSVKSFSFSNDSKWLVYQKAQKNEKSKEGTSLILKSLVGRDSTILDFVASFSIDSASMHIAYIVLDTLKENNGLYITSLAEPGLEKAILTDSLLWVDEMCWNNQSGELFFISGLKSEKDKKTDASLYSWKPGTESAKIILEDKDLAEGWKLYHTNKLRWSKDGSRLFFGIKPVDEIIQPEDDDTIVEVYNLEKILEKEEVDVWHWNDPYIMPNQKTRWKREKDRTYTCVYFYNEKKYVQLTDKIVPDIRINESGTYMLGSSILPYARKITWDGWIQDYYRIDIRTGDKKLLLKEQRQEVNMSPDGNFLVYYQNSQWYLKNTANESTENLTVDLNIPFADEDWDYPEDIPGYGIGGWTEHSEAVIIYDKYDIWMFPTNGDKAICLTEGEGRKQGYQFRIRKLDRDKLYFNDGEEVLLSAYHDMEKNSGIATLQIGIIGVKILAEGACKYSIKTKAKDAEKILFSRESFTEYPDIYVSDLSIKKPLKLTDFGEQTEEFTWGDAELVEWNSVDGIPLQGILIKPGNYDPSKTYPVLVYYYRFFSQRLYDFPQMVINHRPNFAYYSSNDYAIFLPDIRFDIGTPGYSATKCLVPGVQKLIDMGVADPGAIGLHGHSWSGYQTAFVITQTDIFAAAIAGAPVSNMTSAYSGIRWGTGLARQFQYEQSQSRIGGSLWEARDKYIENSPVFFADRINTPLLIMFGDEDDAVPWYQGIELYLAMRRLDKDCIFLQYRGEPHHPKKYPNKLDYTIRFKEYLDHYLKGEEPAEWIIKGEPYKGK